MKALMKAARAAIRKHGGVRAAAAALGIDYSVLSRLASGQRASASNATRVALGLPPAPIRFGKAA
jgi:hypothetical protein